MTFYSVHKGNKVGIFNNWNDCNESINGFKGAVFKKFDNKQDAEYFSLTGIEPNHEIDNFDYGTNTLDGMYCRWALAWISNPKEILEKISKALVPQGKMVIQEYYDWSTHQTKPEMPALKYAIARALESFKNTDSEIDIGAYIPKILTELGIEICSIRLMSKIAKPDSKVWGWPTTFYDSYFPRLKSMGFITNHEEEQAYRDIKTLSKLPYATICCPLMVEVIAQKT